MNPNGSYVVVVKAENGSGNFTINGLPAGAYGIFYSTHSTYNVVLSDVTLGAGQGLTTGIPGEGAITIYNKNAGPATAAIPSRR